MKRKASHTLTKWSSSGEYSKLKMGQDDIVMEYHANRQMSLPKVKTLSLNFQSSNSYHDIFKNRPSQPYTTVYKDHAVSSNNLPTIRSVNNRPTIHSHKDFSEKERSHKSISEHYTKFNVNFRDKVNPVWPTTERGMEPSKNISEKSATSLTHRIRSKHPSIGENYSKIKLCTVTDNDMILLTQAREEKTRRDLKETIRVNGHVESKIRMVKDFFHNYDSFFKENDIKDEINLELAVLYKEVNIVCLQRIFSPLKIIEIFMVLYDLHYQNMLQANTDENSAKIIDRIKDFFWKAKRGAFEVEITEPELFRRFSDVQGAKRTFLSFETFFKVKSIDALVLTHLFLEYKVALSLKDFRRMMSQLSCKPEQGDLKSLNSIQIPHEPSEEDLRTAEQKLKDEAEQKKKQLKEDLERLKKDIQTSKQGIVDLGGHIGYSSKYLKCIEVCLNNKEILFDIESEEFDRMADMNMPFMPPPKFESEEEVDEKRRIFMPMIRLRHLFSDQVQNEGAQLKKELDLFYQPVEDHMSVSVNPSDSIDDDSLENKSIHPLEDRPQEKPLIVPVVEVPAESIVLPANAQSE